MLLLRGDSKEADGGGFGLAVGGEFLLAFVVIDRSSGFDDGHAHQVFDAIALIGHGDGSARTGRNELLHLFPRVDRCVVNSSDGVARFEPRGLGRCGSITRLAFGVRSALLRGFGVNGTFDNTGQLRGQARNADAHQHEP